MNYKLQIYLDCISISSLSEIKINLELLGFITQPCITITTNVLTAISLKKLS